MRVIAGSARRLQLETVPGMDTRPTTDKIKETLFNILQPRVGGSDFLDLFAGSGAIGIEALSRGASSAVFVENDRRAVTCIKKNLEHTRFTEKSVVLPFEAMSSLARLEREGRQFDLIFMDPPYRKELEKAAILRIAGGSLLAEDGWVIAEAALETDFSWLPGLGLEEFRRKEYKTNMHVFIRKSTAAEDRAE